MEPVSTDRSPAAFAAPPPTQTPLVFRGSAAEYFRIWVVNVLLSIVTLGVYSAWAKVRKRKYFYRNTYLGEDAFDYHADPVKILKGRLIALPLLGGYFAVAYFLPGFDLLFLLAVSPAFPWLLVRSRMFSARNTSYRHIRFTFAPCFREAYRTFFVYGFLTLITVGIAYPVLVYRLRELMVANSGYGCSRFDVDGRASDFFWIYVRGGALLLGASLIVGWIIVAVGGDATGRNGSTLTAYFPTMLVVLIYLGFFAYLSARTTNYIIQQSAIGRHKLRSRLAAHSLWWLYVTNLVAIALSAGLAIPWATIRMARYRLAHTELLVKGDLDDFSAGPDRDVTATGEEIGDIFDFDFGF